MSIVDPAILPEKRPISRAILLTRVRNALAACDPWFRVLGLAWITPLWRLLVEDDPRPNLLELWRLALVPLLSIAAFLTLWATLAPMVQTSLGAIPGPAQVWAQVEVLHRSAIDEGVKRDAFYADQAARNAALVTAGKPSEVKNHTYTGKPTFYRQILTSIQTVFTGFVLATLVAVPLGIIAGLSPTAQAAINPLLQIFKPVSPLAWLPIVTMVVTALSAGSGGMSKSFVISAVTVMLCSLWPTLINTSLGVASIDKDLVNVSKVLKLSTWTKITRLVLPSALPLIFTGLRLSLGVGWMVLIAAEMLAQNPGLGKFVWDEFQNGSEDSLARIMVAVLTIGIIGFLLDRVMFALQQAFTFSANR